jgi:threonine dehydrogenase-like Zn-dependent dehydrogenase
MLALTVTPGKQNSLDLENVGSPPVCDAVIVRMLTLGICGTDLEIIKGEYGWSPPGTDQLIIGHESPQRWREAFHRNTDDIKVVIDFAD